MLERAESIVKEMSESTREIILMHSLSGKDSIALLELCYPYFDRIVCVFMYTVPNLRHIMNYYAYARKRYPKAEFIQVPHYSLFNYRKYGFLGAKGNDKQRLWKFSDIIDKVREKTCIEWTCIGFKQSDSLNRRLMLRSYKDGKEAICWAGKKFYPLSTYKNKEVLEYIRYKHLKNPEWFDKSEQSSGVDITDYHYLKYLEKNYPQDLQKIYDMYPAAQLVIPNHEEELKRKENERNRAKRDKDNQA